MSSPQITPDQTQQPTPNQERLARQQVLDGATESITRLINFRRQYDIRRSIYYRQYLNQREGQKFPDNITPRSNTFFPYPQSNVEEIVSRVSAAYFSFWPWFECRGRTSEDEMAAEPMQLVLDYKLHRSGFTKHFEDLVRNIGIYGHAAIKVDWDWDYDIVTYAQPVPAIDPHTGQPVVQIVTNPQNPDQHVQQPVILGYRPAQKKVPRQRPKFIAIDVYDLAVDPDGTMIVHMVDRTFGQLKREAETYKSVTGQDLYYPDAIQDIEMKLMGEKDPNSIIIRIAELWDTINKTCTYLVYGKDSEALSYKDMRYALRSGGSYQHYRRKTYGGAPILLWHGPNPFSHQRIPILHTSYVKLPNEVYGIGAVELISEMTESLNRFVNMITDNWNLGINRRYAYDTTADIDHNALNNANVPGGRVAVTGDPSKVIMPLPFFTPNAGDYGIIDLYKGMIAMSSGIDDFYGRGVGSPTGNRTATGINQVIGESNNRFQMFIRNLEFDILQPLLEMCASMVQQFLTDPEEVLITDAPPGIPKYRQISPEELIGTMHFDMVAANYANNKMVRQRNLMALVNVVGHSPYWREREGLEEICKVFEIRGYNRFLKTEQEV